ncbi:MAG: hypothetical protein AAF571_09605 [Verrucomicrobiota bacterium]
MSLESEILECIRTDLDEEAFNQAALTLFNYQSKANLPYRNYLRSLGVASADVYHWTEIPALPTSTFRDQRVACFPPIETTKVFETSGTTEDHTGRHEFAKLDCYQKSLMKGFVDAMPDVSQYHWISLIPSYEVRPTGSLSFMVSTLAYHYSEQSVDFLCDAEFNFEPEDLFEKLIECSMSETPIFMLGTSFAFARLFESLMESRVQTALPPNSVLFDTGGYKGRHKEYTRPEFLELIDESLGIKPEQIWNEYGMTELSSQAYSRSDIGYHTFPAWTRVVVRDPATGALCSNREQGVIQILDLANIGSVLAVSTQDLGIMHGDRHLELLGRVDSESLRGCSLNYE